MMTVSIRQSTIQDAESIGNLAAEFHSYLRAFGDQAQFDWNAAKYVRDGFGENPAFEGLVAEVDSRVVAYALYHEGYDSDRGQRLLYLIDLYVSEAFRRQGVGEGLMQRLSEIARTRSSAAIVWYVLKGNTPALRFYEKWGAKYQDDVHIMWCPTSLET